MVSPVFAVRTSGPTKSTSPHTQRFGAGAAVAGISNPLRDVRSPLSGFSTTMRSPVKRMSSVLVVWERFFRAFDGRGFEVLAASAMAAIVAALRRAAGRRHPARGYDARPKKARP